MTFLFADAATPRNWRDVAPGAVLLTGTGVFLHCAILAVLVSRYDSDGQIWRLSSTDRQGYAHAWLMGLGLACWGGAIFPSGSPSPDRIARPSG